MRSEFCTPECIWTKLCKEIDCPHLEDVAYIIPLKGKMKIGGRVEDITIIGENTTGVRTASGMIGQKWYLSDGSAIQYRNPLVKLG
jgi:hypothetical protein